MRLRSNRAVDALALGLFLVCESALGAGPPSGLDVRVINTPLAVQGTVAISNLPNAPQLVTLHADFSDEGNCPPFAGKVANFNVAFNPDGSTAPFAVPAGSSLVITAVEILGFSGVPNAGIQTRLFRVGTGSNVQEFSIRESIADSTGRIFHRYEFPAGVEVASGTSVCSNANDFNLVTTGYLYGFVKRAP